MIASHGLICALLPLSPYLINNKSLKLNPQFVLFLPCLISINLTGKGVLFGLLWRDDIGHPYSSVLCHHYKTCSPNDPFSWWLRSQMMCGRIYALKKVYCALYGTYCKQLGSPTINRPDSITIWGKPVWLLIYELMGGKGVNLQCYNLQPKDGGLSDAG